MAILDSKVHVANMGPIWGRQDPDGSHVGPMNIAIWDGLPIRLETTFGILNKNISLKPSFN